MAVVDLHHLHDLRHSFLLLCYIPLYKYIYTTMHFSIPFLMDSVISNLSLLCAMLPRTFLHINPGAHVQEFFQGDDVVWLPFNPGLVHSCFFPVSSFKTSSQERS